MYLLSLKCDNMYLFSNFNIDFTYKRKLTHPLAQGDDIFEGSAIHVRKKLVVLGGNASGKTTFGKLLCVIFNFLIRQDLYINNSADSRSLETIRYDKTRPASFSFEVSFKNFVYRISVQYDKMGIISECFQRVSVDTKDNIVAVREKLDNQEGTDGAEYFCYRRSSKNLLGKKIPSFLSHIVYDEKLINFRKVFLTETNFCFLFSDYETTNDNNLRPLPIAKLKKILPIIDTSVVKITDYQPEEKNVKTQTSVITFKNGDEVLLKNGIVEDKNRLSFGTNETMYLLRFFEELHHRNKGIFYLDEKMAHMHSELELYLTNKIFHTSKSNQVFITTHNSELLNLNIPKNSFMVFKRNENGSNDVIFTDAMMIKNDRMLKNYYDNDFFGVLPDYSDLDITFEDYTDEK